MMKVSAIIVSLAACVLGFGAGLDLEKDEFVLGFYSADNPNDQNFQLIREAGINYVHTYSTGNDDPQSLARARQFLDLARKYDLKVMFDIRGRKWINSEQESFLNMIREFKNHPALGMWYLFDEPDIKLVPKIEQLHQALKEETPDIPCSLVIHWVDDWYKARTACDILMVDLYPVRSQPFPESKLDSYTSYIRSATRLKNPSKPIFGVMQSMNWECMRENLTQDPEVKFRFPNSAEMRNMAYASIALGVRGLFFYSFYHIHVTPITTGSHKAPKANMDWYLEVFKPFCLEIKEFTSLIHPAWEVTACSDRLNKIHNVYLSYWERSSGKFLVLTNNTRENRSLNINLKEIHGIPQNGKLTPYGNTRPNAGALQNGILNIDETTPWESFVWKIEQ